jgi:antitoxin MazE
MGETMTTRVQKWGNSLAIRIPKACADEIKLKCNSEVDVTVRDGVLTVSPVARQKYTLEELLAGITEENRHTEIDTGPSVGNETW